jgi:hypothetical protein
MRDDIGMYFFHERLVEYAIAYFNAVDFGPASDGDTFWGLFAPGNTVYFSERPFEGFNDYEEMLLRLRASDAQKYERMHKGTPFYYMSWLAFDLRNYEKALFYIDSAISEDVRRTRDTQEPQAWKHAPGAKFLLLEEENQPAKRTIVAVRTVLTQEFDRFNGVSQKPPLDLGSIAQFVTTLLEDASKRTIISALYVFLLEFGDRVRELELRRGSVGGSSEPFTVHLFTGSLLFESLLKHFYPVNDSGQQNRQLGSVFHTAAFLREFRLADAPETSANTLREIHDAIGNRSPIEAAFSTAAKLRNTTGHNLVWDDLFSDSEKYTDLFRQVVNAILYVITTKAS